MTSQCSEEQRARLLAHCGTQEVGYESISVVVVVVYVEAWR